MKIGRNIAYHRVGSRLTVCKHESVFVRVYALAVVVGHLPRLQSIFIYQCASELDDRVWLLNVVGIEVSLGEGVSLV
jgi:hypothetical protein